MRSSTPTRYPLRKSSSTTYRPTPPNPPVTSTLPGASVWREEASSVRTVTARRNEEPIALGRTTTSALGRTPCWRTLVLDLVYSSGPTQRPSPKTKSKLLQFRPNTKLSTSSSRRKSGHANGPTPEPGEDPKATHVRVTRGLHSAEVLEAVLALVAARRKARAQGVDGAWSGSGSGSGLRSGSGARSGRRSRCSPSSARATACVEPSATWLGLGVELGVELGVGFGLELSRVG